MVSKEVLDSYEMTVGIECHVQLSTKTKLFSATDNDARDKSPNSVVSPIDYALPGMLPILNEEAVQLAIRAGHALNSKISNISRFDRKHYFYPDLPKGYQISQMYQPIIGGGKVYVVDPDKNEEVVIRIEHAHLEEDAGKQTHYGNYSLVDLNRSGTPLIEIVSMPDIHSAKIAKGFAIELHRLMMYSGVTIGDLYQGNMRFDVNISVAKKGSKELGKRAEVKNLNSFKSVEKAAEYEFYRQVEILESGEVVKQETRGWNDAKQKTVSQRSKEEAQDYRYMPDPDIPPIYLTDEEIESVKKDMPTLPRDYRHNWKELELDSSVVESLLDNQKMSILLNSVLLQSGKSDAVRTAHWLTGVLSSDGEIVDISNLNPVNMIELSGLVESNKLSSTAAKEVLVNMLTSVKSPEEIATELNLIQVSDESEINKIVDQVLALPESSQAVEDIRSGSLKAIGFLVGLVMKHSKGKANPGLASKVLQEKIKGESE